MIIKIDIYTWKPLYKNWVIFNIIEPKYIIN